MFGCEDAFMIGTHNERMKMRERSTKSDKIFNLFGDILDTETIPGLEDQLSFFHPIHVMVGCHEGRLQLQFHINFQRYSDNYNYV